MLRAQSALVAGMIASIAGLSGGALANGKFPEAAQLVIDPVAPEHLALMTTFGVLDSRDGGASWQWICERAMGYQDYEPAIALSGSGSLVVALADGASVSSDLCSWQPARGVEDRAVQDVSIAAAARRVVVVSCDVAALSCRYHESSDGGATFAAVGSDLPAGFQATTLDVAPSDPDRIYVAGVYDDGGGFDAVVVRSVDRGESWTVHPLPPRDAASGPFLAAVHPTDPDRLYLRLDVEPGRLVTSGDGGASWTAIFEGAGALTGFALAPDGGEVLVGGFLDGLWRADTATHRFDRVSDLGPECLRFGGDALYGCFNQGQFGFFVGVSNDAGASFEPLLDVRCVEQLACASETPTGELCPADWPAVQNTIAAGNCPGQGGAGGSPVVPDAGSSPPSPSNGCGCRAASGDARGSLLFAVALAALRRRRSRSPEDRFAASVVNRRFRTNRYSVS
jgi:photosystem II stability/assembly factor-like uncharacterized protein